MLKFTFILLFSVFSLNTIEIAYSQTPAYTTPYAVTTLAGTAIQGTGYLDATGPNAYFNQPYGIAVDNSGNIYVADSGNYAIRKISQSGVVTTIAGQGQQYGNIDGPALNAKFGVIKGITTDPSGNIYVTDTTYNTVRKITLTAGTWSVSTLVPPSAGLKNPVSITYDTVSGNLFVSDAGNFVIRKVTTTGSMSTFAGTLGVVGGIDGATGTATFGNPSGLVADGLGNLYCIDSPDSTLRKISATGYVSTIGGYIGDIGLLDGPLNNTTAQFSQPYALAIDNKGNLYISDQANLTVIRQVTNNGLVSTLAGTVASSGRSDGTGANANFNQPHGLAVDNTGTIYVADTGSSTIRKMVYMSNSIPPIPVISSATISGIVGSTITPYILYATNNPTSFSVSSSNLSSLGLSLNTSTGMITGTPTVAGNYQLVITATNAGGTSNPAIINLSITSNTLVSAPLLIVSPTSQTISLGSPFTLTVTATGTGVTYQWYLNGAAISGATNASYNIASVAQENGGSYTVVISNSAGSVTSQPAQLTVVTPSRLLNLSVLSFDGPGSELLTIGFVSGGIGSSGVQNLLIRGCGPALALPPFNIPNVLQDPSITVYNSSTQTVAANDNWGTPASNATSVTAADTATGAFTLNTTSSLDAALVTSLTPGSYTVQVTGKNGSSGNVIAEVYDNTPNNSITTTTPRLVNLSCLEQISAGGVLTAGFVIGGTTPEQVLIRASGPTLSSPPFNLPGTLSDPQLTVFNSASTILATNSGWGGNTAITAANLATGAFQFSSNSSRDSAVLITLLPGAYTVQANSTSGKSGIALIEIYEVPVQ